MNPTYLADIDVLIAPWANKYSQEEAMDFFQNISPFVTSDSWETLEFYKKRMKG